MPGYYRDETTSNFRSGHSSKHLRPGVAQGKTDFDHIKEFTQDFFFQNALGINRIPSAEILRQRFEHMSSCSEFEERIHECALDLGSGWMINAQLREGSAHSFTAGTTEFIDQSLDYAHQLVDAPVLLLADGGFDSADLFRLLDKRANTGCIVKHNLRKKTEAQWLLTAKQYGRLVKQTKEMDMERLPFGKFAVNSAFLKTGMLVYNMFKVIDQDMVYAKALGLKKATRRRMKTIMRSIVYMCRKITRHSHRLILQLASPRPWYEFFSGLLKRLQAV